MVIDKSTLNFNLCSIRQKYDLNRQLSDYSTK